MIKQITYEAEDGTLTTGAYIAGHSAYALTGKREKFAQLMARGKLAVDAYIEAWDLACTEQALDEAARKRIWPSVQDLLNDTTVVLRIQELKRPVIRRIKQKMEYNLQKALEQCQVAYDLAYAQGNSKGLLDAIRLQSDLAKLLTQELNVNHRYGLLDDASTEVLLAMKKEIEIRQAKQKQLARKLVTDVQTVSEGGQAPAVVPSDGSHPRQ